MASDDAVADLFGEVSDDGNTEPATGTRLVNTMPEDCEAADIAAIVDRIDRNTFPLVQPSEQTCVKETSAAETLSWAKKCEAVELQSYIDEMWRLYRQTAIVDDEKPEAVRRAT